MVEIEKFGFEVPQNTKDASLFCKGRGNYAIFFWKIGGKTPNQRRRVEFKEWVGERNGAKQKSNKSARPFQFHQEIKTRRTKEKRVMSVTAPCAILTIDLMLG